MPKSSPAERNFDSRCRTDKILLRLINFDGAATAAPIHGLAVTTASWLRGCSDPIRVRRRSTEPYLKVTHLDVRPCQAGHWQSFFGPGSLVRQLILRAQKHGDEHGPVIVDWTASKFRATPAHGRRSRSNLAFAVLATVDLLALERRAARSARTTRPPPKSRARWADIPQGIASD